MVAAWGGYVFIINIIPIYVVVMIVGGRFSYRLYTAYSVFYSLGSLMAMTVPFVGFNVINQAECAASHGVFLAIQVYAVLNYLYQIVDAKILRGLFTTIAFGIVGSVAFILISLQLLGKIQWSGRSLTLLDPTYASKYIPIIASVSEHQPTTWTSFFFDLHVLVPLAPVGLFFSFNNVTDGAVFIILYGTLAWYFAGVMVRLMLTLAPIACVLAAIGISTILTRFSALVKTNSISTGIITGMFLANMLNNDSCFPYCRDRCGEESIILVPFPLHVYSCWWNDVVIVIQLSRNLCIIHGLFFSLDRH